MHVSFGLYSLRICPPFELVHLKVDILLSIDIFLMSVRQRYTQSFALKFTETEAAESASFTYFTRACFVVILSPHK